MPAKLLGKRSYCMTHYSVQYHYNQWICDWQRNKDRTEDLWWYCAIQSLIWFFFLPSKTWYPFFQYLSVTVSVSTENNVNMSWAGASPIPTLTCVSSLIISSVPKHSLLLFIYLYMIQYVPFLCIFNILVIYIVILFWWLWK